MSRVIENDVEESFVQESMPNSHIEEGILGELANQQEVTAEERAAMFYGAGDLDVSRASYRNNDVSFFSQGGPSQGQSFRHEYDEDEDQGDNGEDGGAFNFDNLMAEKVARDSFRASEAEREAPA